MLRPKYFVNLPSLLSIHEAMTDVAESETCQRSNVVHSMLQVGEFEVCNTKNRRHDKKGEAHET